MKRLFRATGWLVLVRLAFVLVAATPLGLSLRFVSSRHPDGDDALFSELLPRLGDVLTREPRTLLLPLVWLGLLVILGPLGEGFVDRVTTTLLAGGRVPEGLAAAARDLFPVGAVSVLATTVRLAAVACIGSVVRHEALTPKALALPITVALLLGAFVALVLGLRDLVCVPTASRVRSRLQVALVVLQRYPVRLGAWALGSRALGIACSGLGLLLAANPQVLHGGRLAFTYGVAATGVLATALLRAARFQALGALAARARPRLAESLRPEDARTSDRSDAPDAPSPDPAA